MEEAAVEAEVTVIKDSADVEMKVETANGVADVEEKAAKDDTPSDSTGEKSKENGANHQAPATNNKKRKTQSVNSSPVEGSRSSKRSRKTAETFRPENFGASKPLISIIDGRGTKLQDIPNVKARLESFGTNSKEIVVAHKFVFRANMGKEVNKHRLEHLLEFSGYLPIVEDEQERNKVDKKIETKYSQKAYHLTIPELKFLCDVFDVDRSPASIDKDELVERLCDFLSEPTVELTNATKSTTAKPKKSKKKTTKKKKKKDKDVTAQDTEDETEDEEDSESDDNDEPSMPSTKALRKWVKAYVTCFNHEKVTLKHAIQTASDKFGVNMKEMKSTLKTMLTEEI